MYMHAPLSLSVFLMCYCVSTNSDTIATVEQFHQTGRCMALIVPFIQMLFTLSPWILHMFLQITQLDVIVKAFVFQKNGKVCLFGLFTVSLVVADSLDLYFFFFLFFLLFSRKWITSIPWSWVVSSYISFCHMGLIEGLKWRFEFKIWVRGYNGISPNFKGCICACNLSKLSIISLTSSFLLDSYSCKILQKKIKQEEKETRDRTHYTTNLFMAFVLLTLKSNWIVVVQPRR